MRGSYSGITAVSKTAYVGSIPTPRAKNSSLVAVGIFCYSECMLTPDQENYLNSLPNEVLNKLVRVQPYNSEIFKIAESVIGKIEFALPDAQVLFMGASALKISGQNDIDIYVLSEAERVFENVDKLNKLFGEVKNNSWIQKIDGYEVTIYSDQLGSSSLKEQVRVFELLKNNPKLLKEYELLKFSIDGKTYKEYQQAKYEFYNKLLNQDSELVYIDDYGLEGSNFYWHKFEAKGMTKEDVLGAGLKNDRVQVHKEIIPALKKIDEIFKGEGYKLFIKEGYRSKALYEMIFKRRSEKFGKEETERLMNMTDMPHATGKTVDVALYDLKENKEIYLRDNNDGVDALFINFYRSKTDSKSQKFQELQDFLISTMLDNGFRLGTKKEYFHFNYDPSSQPNY